MYFHKLFVLFYLAFIFSSKCISQNFNEYVPLKSQGEIPGEFLVLSSEKYRKDVAHISDKENHFTRKTKSQFYLESDFFVNRLLLSGKIIFNDPISDYIKKTADILLKNESELRKHLTFYIVKSSAINAYTTDDGHVFITIGLLSKIENEAQLAFILSHEITHYTKKHVINYYVARTTIDKKRGIEGRKSFEEKMLAKSKYSKENESEADMEGVKRILTTYYDPNEVLSALSILRNENLPFASVKSFDKFFFERDYLKFPPSYSLKNITPVEENDNDSLSTHPNISKRIEAVKKLLPTEFSGKKLFLSDSSAFYLIRKISRFELCRLYLINEDFEKAIYASYNLLQENPDSKYLKQIIEKAIYSLSLYKNSSSQRENTKSYSEYPDDMQRVSFFLDSLKKEELNILALLYSSEMQQYGKLSSQKIFDELINEYAINYYHKDSVPSLLSYTASTEHSSCELALQHLKSDASFNYKFNSCCEKMLLPKLPESKLSVQEQLLKEQKIKKIGYSLGLDSILILDPMYMRVDLRKKNPVSYIASENALIQYNKNILKNTKKLKMFSVLLSTNALKENDTELFNDITLLKNFFEEKTNNRIDLLSTDYEDILKISEKYHCNHIAMVGEISVHSKEKGRVGVLLLSAALWPTLPFGLIYALSPAYSSYNFILLYNIPQQKEEFETVHFMTTKDNQGTINSSLYYNFLQVKRKSK